MSAPRATVILTPEAQEDLEDILQYGSEQWGDDQANAYLAALRSGLESLAHFPELGRRRDELRPGRRSHRVRQHVIIYRIDDDRVIVLRILHTRMDATRHLGREPDDSESPS